MSYRTDVQIKIAIPYEIIFIQLFLTKLSHNILKLLVADIGFVGYLLFLQCYTFSTLNFLFS